MSVQLPRCGAAPPLASAKRPPGPMEGERTPDGPRASLAQGGAVVSPSAPAVAAAGGGSPPREEVNIQILEMMKDFREQMKAPASAGPRGMTADEISAITQRGGSPLAGLEFKQTLPVIKDSDLDFDRHMREFRGIVDCYAMNRKEGIRPYDLLVVFRRTLPANSTRLKIYDNVLSQAQKDKRLPHQAQAVYDAILHKMRDTLRESVITKQTRVETEFTQLEMGRLPHSAFLTEAC